MQATLNGIQVDYAEDGSSDGQPLVFIHGFTFDRHMWDGQLAVLPEGYRAISYDVRGHGNSGSGDGQYSLELFVDDLIALLDHLQISRAVLCGLSMGGYIALRTIERHPDRVCGLILCDTRSEADPNEGRLRRMQQLQLIKQRGLQPFAREFVRGVLTEQSLRERPELVHQVCSRIENGSPLGLCGTLLALAARTDTTGALNGIRVPTLILVGEHDALTPPAAAHALQQGIAGSILRVIPSAAHMSNLENPGFFNEQLLGFLASLD